MKEISVGEHNVAYVDDQDFEAVSCLKWVLVHRDDSTQYAVSHQMVHGKLRNILMHRFILNPPKKLVIDHINGDGLDNRRCNLRPCTMKENIQYGAMRRKVEHEFYLKATRGF